MIDRYSRPEMRALWSDETKFATWLKVELLASEAWAALGKVPPEDVRRMRERARIDVPRILAIETQVRHDVIAFTTQVSETLGPEGRFLHYGLTSSDVVDTAFALLLCRAVDLILVGLDGLSAVLREQARRYQGVVLVGRTHGVHAEPTTLALKFALWYQETLRSRQRLLQAKERIAVGKLSGAVGTFAHLPCEIEAYVCEHLGLTPDPISTQILQRDRHAELMAALAILATSLDKFATEIRALQKTEVRELEEPFLEGQKGSSAMPHKRNPVTCEQVSGLARVVRSNLQAALEDIVLWHERDISHSSVERVIFPDSTTLVDYMLAKMTEVMASLHVYPDAMQRNLAKSQGLIYSQRVLLALVEGGMDRQAAYGCVQRAAMAAWNEQRPFLETLWREPPIREQLGQRELAALFDPDFFIRKESVILQRAGILD